MPDTSFVASEEPHPALLTRKGTDALIAVEHMLDDASHALTAQDAATGAASVIDGKQGALTSPNTVATVANARGD
jgi:hypothetical protein